MGTLVLAVVQMCGDAFQHAAEEMKNDEAIVLAAVRMNGFAFRHASPEVKDNERLVSTIVQKMGWTLQFASERMRNNETVVMAALEGTGPVETKRAIVKMASTHMQDLERVRDEVGI